MKSSSDNGSRSHDEPAQASFAQFMSQGWTQLPVSGNGTDPVAPFAKRRRDLLSSALGVHPIVVGSGHYKVRANDTDYPFRPHSNFYWLTGCTEPDAVLVMLSVAGGHDATLYVPERSDHRSAEFYRNARYGELWVGPREGVTEIGDRLDIATRPLSKLIDDLASVSGAAVGGEGVEIDSGKLDPELSQRLNTELSELRLIKDSLEIGLLRAAVDATVRGFNECIAELAVAKSMQRGERWLEGTFWRRSRAEGNDVGYGSIVAAGRHATTLHWMRNNGEVRDGELLLMDMGVESDSLYTADVTRTVPISGQFSPAQRQVYEVVVRAQQAGLDAVSPGRPFLAAHQAAMEVCAQALFDWGVLPVSVDETLSEDPKAPGAGMHRRFTLHGTSHMLGLDVHDCAQARNQTYRSGDLVENMVLTVEPGIYFQANDETVPPELRGIGVRIEDDVLVTANGVENLSEALPRAADDVEAWVSSQG